MNIEEYITTLTEQIRCERARQGVAEEIRNHILDQTQKYERDGMEHERAEELAVREMGDPVETGTALDRVHRPQFDWRIFAMTALFSVMGAFLMYATGTLGEGEGALAKQLFYSLFGLGVVLAVYFIDYTFLGKYALPAYVLVSAALFVYSLTAPRVNGMVPALRNLAWLYVPLYAGILYRYRGGRLAGMVKAVLFLIVTAALSLFFTKSFFVSINIGMLCAVLLLYAIYKEWYAVHKKRAALLIVLLLATLIAGYFALFATDYQKQRLLAFFIQSSDANYLLTRAREVIVNAKLVGGGEQTLSSGLVQDNMLLIFAQTIAMYGIMAGVAVAAAFALWLCRALRIVKRQKNQFGMMLSAACFLVLLFHCAAGVLMNVGLYPIGGVLQFPFLNRGGSIGVLYAVLTGLLMSCQRYEKIPLNEAEACRPNWRWEVRVSVRRRE